MFKGHPRGLIVLAIANMGERFGYYTMLAILALYMQAKFGLSSSSTSIIYGTFLSMVYFLPLVGGTIADRFLGYGRTIFLGIIVMFTGYLLLAVPTDANNTGFYIMFCALALISMGTGLFKGNLQALVGNLYEADQFKGKRDIAFSIFYMFINIGAFFAPSAANSINNAVLGKEHFTYDASVPKSYVTLNDKLVDKKTFQADLFKDYRKNPMTQKDSILVIEKAKKKLGVLFQEDRDKALFKLKASGLNQLTNAGLIKDPVQQLSLKDYRLLESKRPEDRAEKAAIKERINAISVTDPKLYGDPQNPDAFASNFGKQYVVKSLTKSYNLAFAIACLSLIISVLVFLGFRKTWKAVDVTHKQKLKQAATDGVKADVVILSPKQVKERVVALLLVFFVVIFFWMSFHQNGLCMTFFARDYTESMISPLMNMVFSLMALLPFILFTYGIYHATMGLFGGKQNPVQGMLLSALGLSGLLAYYFIVVKDAANLIPITPQIFQQFNPLFIVLLTPVAVAFFTYLGDRGKEPSAPRKIGYGMLIATIGFIVLIIASVGLPAPADIQGVSNILVSPAWLIGTYFILTLAELFLSPMGISFVAKVAPPQYKGMMQGGWLAATAIGNYLVGVLGVFWDELPMFAFWGVLVICCLLSSMFMFSILKRLEKVTK